MKGRNQMEPRQRHKEAHNPNKNKTSRIMWPTPTPFQGISNLNFFSRLI